MCLSISAQEVSGVVVDAKSGAAVIGASVVLEGTTTGTVTNLDGEFTIDISGVEDPALMICKTPTLVHCIIKTFIRL